MLGLWDCWNPRFQRFHGPNAAGEGPVLTWGFSCAAAVGPAVQAGAPTHGLRAKFPRACAAGPVAAAHARGYRLHPAQQLIVWPGCVYAGPSVVGAPNAPRCAGQRARTSRFP